MKFGLSDDQYEILERLLIQPLKQKKANLYVFGSRARGDFHPYSDIDILFTEEENNVISFGEIVAIKEALEESKLTIKVDLVNSKNLAASYVKSVNSEKVLIE